MKAILSAAMLAALVACQTTPSAGSIRIGTDLQEAIRHIVDAGGRPFECGYKGGERSACMTLRNGATVHLCGEPTISGIEICNSTLLHCCKGETWYPVESIDPGSDRIPSGPWIGKGMARGEIERRLTESKARHELGASWHLFVLPGNIDLLVRLSEDSTVDLLILEATTPKGPSRRARVECELVDPAAPLREGWSWAFGPEWDWNPADPDRMKKQGHRR